MKHMLYFSAIATIMLSCGGVKKTRQAVNEGNNQWAIYQSIDKISKDKSSKRNQSYILLLEEAFQKFTQAELAKIEFMEMEGDPEDLNLRYNSLSKIKHAQDRISSLLPLEIIQEQRMASFNFLDLDQRLLDTKSQLVDYTYHKGVDIYSRATSKADYRMAWEVLDELENLQPDFKDTREIMAIAREKGTYSVLLTVENYTDFELPEILVLELLDVNTTRGRNNWAQLHRYFNPGTTYDYEVILALDQLSVAPDRLHENQKIIEKTISEGKKVVLNRKGEVVRDSLGNPVETEQFTRVKSNFRLITQEKSGMLSGSIAIIQANTGESLAMKKVSGNAFFRHQYAVQRGDERALEKWQRRLLKRGPQPFPTSLEIASLASTEIRSDLEWLLRNTNFD